MKKTVSIILTLVLLMSLAPLCIAADTGKYIAVNEVTSVFASPSLAAKKIAEITRDTIVEITEIRNDSFGRLYLAKDGVSGWVQMGALELMSEPAENKNITGIKITSLPEKLSYTDGIEELDLTGLSVVSVDKSGREAALTGYNVYAPEMKVPGTKEIKITYSPDRVNTLEAVFSVTVTRLPVESISVSKKPVAVYMENQELDLSGLELSVNFSDSTKKYYTYEQIKNDPDFTVSACHNEAHGTSLSKGQHTIKITYKYSDISASLTVEVTPRKLVSLSVKQQPANLTVYSNTSVPSLDGLVLEAVYDNGEREDIHHYNCEAVCEPSEFIIGPGNKVRAYFGGMFVTLEFRYSVAIPEKILLDYPAGFRLTFLKGEEIDLSGIRVKLAYTDGTSEYVTDYRMSTPDVTVTGTQHITVVYKEFSEVFSINISPYFSKGDVDGNGNITAYDARQVLRASVGLVSLSGMTFFAGDADRNDKITANDARLILRASVDLENLYITI